MSLTPRVVDKVNTGALLSLENEAERDEVRRQLERLINSPQIGQSRRYSTLLQYIVEQALGGHREKLKERSIGIEVFQREPAYDTAEDPVVRTTAAQLRRRMAQYYLCPEHEAEPVITLPPGSYVPEFRAAPALGFESQFHSEVTEGSTGRSGPPESPPNRSVASKAAFLFSRQGSAIQIPRHLIWASLIGAFIGAALCCALLLRTPGGTALRSFWGPIWKSSDYVLLVIGQPHNRPASPPSSLPNNTSPNNTSPSNTSPSNTSPSDTLPSNTLPSNTSSSTGEVLTIGQALSRNSIAWPDAITFSSLAALAKANGKSYRLQKANDTTFPDMRNASAILVGGYNNQWIMRLNAPLRFRYQHDSQTGIAFIQDQQHPTLEKWAVNFHAPNNGFVRDYGVITRVMDPTTERFVVIASGIASFGTIAAGEFLTTDKYMQMVAERAPQGWEHKNMQVVFSTDVINGNSGPPQILNTYFW